MWTNHISLWDDYIDPIKVVFDGINRLIYIQPMYSSIDVKIDLYSAFKRWIQRRQNAQYLPAFRTTGGDPVGGGLFSGDIYFLINGWQIVIEHTVKITGILYNDDPSQEVYVIKPGGGVTSIVSNLAIAYNQTGSSIGSSQEIADAVWNNPDANALSTNVDTIKSSMDYMNTQIESIPNANEMADAVWNRPVEATFTAEQILKIAAAVLAGRVSGAGTGQEVFMGLDGTTVRVVSTNDSNGNRMSVDVSGV